MEQFTYVCPCHFGLESVLMGELRRMGADGVSASDGKVAFTGSIKWIARANLCLRTAERVLIELGSFPAHTFDDLFEGVRALPWERWIDRNAAFPVKGHALKSKLHSIPDCQAIVKKAVVERLKEHMSETWFSETGPRRQIQFLIRKDTAALYLDTTGDGLHKRGYRKNATTAPIRETLACGIIDLAHVKPSSIVYDPFCGSGTFLIESAMKAAHIPPGIHRRFAAESWPQIDPAIWQSERETALSQVSFSEGFYGFGSDIDSEAISLSQSNAKKAGVLPRLQFQTEDVEHFSPKGEGGIVLCNPPYGERLVKKQEAEKLIVKMGRVFLKRPGWSYYIISPSERFETLFGRRADKRRKLYNGMIPCQLYMYFR